MKIPEKRKDKKDKTKKKQKIKPKKEHVLIVAQEFKFARLLSGNEKKTRDRVLKTLKKWLLNCFEKGYEFKEDDFIRVWKGLFYAVWMSDKPLIQEELCENIAGVLDLFPAEHLRHALLMYQAGLRVLASEWYGLDQHRTDKFLMLVRRYLRASLRCLSRCEWSLHSCQMYANTLTGTNGIFALKTPHYARNALSMLLHIVDCYLEEIAKVSGGSIPPASLAELLRPLATYMCSGAAPALAAACRRLMTSLLRQTELGIQYAQATQAWQKMGCPEGGPEALELVSDDDEEQNGDEVTDDEDDSAPSALDPRAGRVDVELPSLPAPAAELAQLMRQLLPTAASASHKRLRICLDRFEQLARNEYPLRVQTHTEHEEPSPPARVRRNRSAAALHALEKKLIANSDELALRGLGRKHRKRLLARSRAGASIVEELAGTHTLSTETATSNGDWQVEPAEPEAKKQKTSPNKIDNKRKHNATDTGDKKRRKSDTNVKGNAANERLKVAEKSLVVNKIENDKKVVNGKLENNKKVVNGKLGNNKKVVNGKPKNNNIEVNSKLENNTKVVNGKLEKKNKVNNLKNKQNGIQTVKVVAEKVNNIVKKPIVTPKLATPNNNVPVKLDTEKSKPVKQPTVLVNKVKSFQKQTNKIENSDKNNHFDTPKKVKFALKNNSMQQPFEYYKSVRQSPNIPYDSSKQPSKTNLKPSTPSPINPFFKKKLLRKLYLRA